MFGVVLTSAGEIHFSLAGLIFQVSGLVFESLRVVMVKDLMSEDGASMSPLLSLYYYAPTCAVNNLIVALAAESGRIQWSDISHTGIHILVMNALVAFLLNVSSVLLVSIYPYTLAHVHC